MLTDFSDLSDCAAADSVKHKALETMELLYVWIEDYKNIKKQGFNFSPKHWFDFEYEEEDGKVIGGTLHHKERNSNYPENFFGENISNVTAIVGKNGSGKSNLLEFIISIFAEEFDKSHYYALAFSNSKHEILKYNFCNIHRSHYYTEIQKCLNNISTLYYSNIVTNRIAPDFIKHENIVDISTTSLIDNFTLDEFHSHEVYNQICAGLHYKNLIEKYFELPEELTLDIFNILHEYKTEDKEFIKNYFNYTENGKILKVNKKKITQLSFFNEEEITDPQNLLNLFYYKILKTALDIDQRLENALKLLLPEPNFKTLIAKLLKVIEPAVQLELWKDIKIEAPLYKKYLKVITLFEDILQKANYENTPYSLKVKINDLQEFLIAYSSISSNPLCKIKWHNLSSGEIGILNLFSRFHTSKIKLEKDHSKLNSLQRKFQEESYSFVSDHIETLENYYGLEEYYNEEKNEYLFGDLAYDIFNDIESLKFDFENNAFLMPEINHLESLLLKINSIISTNSLLILLDEGDLYFHPQWQKGFLNIVSHASSIIFPNFNIQLILTTHSPFLISDLPIDNCLYPNLTEFEKLKQCFGANIHSLYCNSFFLKNGLMGDFAKNKIEQVIKDLKIKNTQSNLSEERKNEILFIINQIGEPILHHQLLKRFKEIFQPLQDRINELKIELKQLEEQQIDLS